MKRVRIQFISRGFHDLLESPEIAREVEYAANRVANKAAALSKAKIRHTKGRVAEYVVKGPKKGGYGGGRQVAYVAASNKYAYGDAARNMILEKAINSLRIH